MYICFFFGPLTEQEFQVLDTPEVRKLLAPTVELSDSDADNECVPHLAELNNGADVGQRMTNASSSSSASMSMLQRARAFEDRSMPFSSPISSSRSAVPSSSHSSGSVAVAAMARSFDAVTETESFSGVSTGHACDS